IASHSHFLMRDIYDSPYWREHGGVLPGIIIGTAGAIRYRLPDTVAGFPRERAQTDVYGYLLANVDAATGNITFDFKEVKRDDIPYRPAVTGSLAFSDSSTGGGTSLATSPPRRKTSFTSREET